MKQRTVSVGRLRGATVASLAVAATGLALLAADPAPPVPPCTATLVTSPSPTKPNAPPADPAVMAPAPESATPATTSPIARLYMPDGQLISHGLTVYVNADLHTSRDLKLRLFRNHAITEATADEDRTLSPALVASGQQWTETFQGRQIYPTGTILIFNTSSMSFGGRAMVRVRPLLTWKEGSTEHCALGAGEVNVGDIIFATVWTTTAVVVTILLVVVLALTKKDNPMRLLTGVDGHLALSQVQVACWTIFVGSIVLMYGLIRREIPDIPESLLVLMGASLATGGLAYFQDAKNASAAATTGTQLTARSWAWSDLIRVFPPGEEPAPSLAKAQMLFWTVLLLVLFVSKSILDGQIWAVPWPLVALMGFSQVGYLAPKVANPATPTPAPPATGSSTPPAPPPSGLAGDASTSTVPPGDGASSTRKD